jgi:hypothetical protein
MERQCAWCLCLIDNAGGRLSSPLPKLYEASHGICDICGSLWMEQVEVEEAQNTPLAKEGEGNDIASYSEREHHEKPEKHETIPQFVLHVLQHYAGAPSPSSSRKQSKVRIF